MAYAQNKNPFLLKKRQEDAMKRHSEHHSKKHIAIMSALMNKGKSFNQAHTETLKIERRKTT